MEKILTYDIYSFFPKVGVNNLYQKVMLLLDIQQ